jgi:hypothetical protein
MWGPAGERMASMSTKLTSWLVRTAVAAGMAGAAGAILGLAGVDSPVRSALVLIFVAVTPTAAIAGLLGGFDGFARLVLACVTTIAVLTVVAMIMLAAGLWSPAGGLLAVAVISASCLIAQRPAIRTRVAARAASWRKALIRRRGGAEDDATQPADGGSAEVHANRDAGVDAAGPAAAGEKAGRETADDAVAAADADTSQFPAVRDPA